MTKKHQETPKPQSNPRPKPSNEPRPDRSYPRQGEKGIGSNPRPKK